ncbi:MAG: hypothetical protein WDW20_01250 [Neisseriaceae bacterium]
MYSVGGVKSKKSSELAQEGAILVLKLGDQGGFNKINNNSFGGSGSLRSG